MIMKGNIVTAIVIAILILPLASAFAEQEGGWTFALGGGALFMNTYAGSDEYLLAPIPEVKARYSKGNYTFSASFMEGLGFTYLDMDHRLFGSLTLYQGNKRDDETYAAGFFKKDHNDRIARLLAGTATVSTLVFGELALGLISPIGIIGTTVEYHPIRYENGSEDFYHGFLGSVFYLLPVPVTDRMMIIGRLAVDFMDDRYADAWYSLPEENSAARTFNADGGIKDFKSYLKIDYALSKHLGVAALALYSRLLCDAEKSPFTLAENQVTAGMYLYLKF